MLAKGHTQCRCSGDGHDDLSPEMQHELQERLIEVYIDYEANERTDWRNKATKVRN